jgi:hypothetical protein
MKLKFIETTYVCQLNKPHNRTMLESYRDRKNSSTTELAHYYNDIITALVDTPAWNVSGVNKMINELTTSVRATLTKAKRGKTSAYAHANKLLSTINRFGDKHADCRYKGNHKLQPLLTADELQELEALEVVA